ncbi:hypothetical protein HNQ59_002754 [Chitinivorax tropicus]|uniref:Phasin domain-containing protein n=1 Tax=Chitinivorax tropicus TaxID=714531 RepID=A0A840MRP5_9PROT|nr:hypothetical protein [Chitinivorax tropicus]MBB5019452.1 hypothetical protein [Chitinivorax tropicus]
MLKPCHCPSTPPAANQENIFSGEGGDMWGHMARYWWPIYDRSWLAGLESSLESSRDYYLASVQAQLRLASVSDQFVGTTRQSVLDFLDQLSQQAPAASNTLTPIHSALEMSGWAYDSLSKATRQVSKFANTNLSAAMVNAVKHGYREVFHLPHFPQRKS